MAALQVVSPTSDIAFFSTCPTSWENLTSIEKLSCIGTQLRRQIEGHFAWAAAGPLLEQWNKSGEQEYSTAIAHRKVSLIRSFRPQTLPGHQLRLLSLTPDAASATPFVIITTSDKDDRTAKATIERLKKHPRISRFTLGYLAQQGSIRITTGVGTKTIQDKSVLESAGLKNLSSGQDISSIDEAVAASYPKSMTGPQGDKPETYSLERSLCGARIAVYAHSGRARTKEACVSTIAAVMNVGDRCYALTVAHVFFDNIDSSKSWADSGLYVTSETNLGVRPRVPIPRSSKIYEVVIESLWPHSENSPDDSDETGPISIGLVAPSLPHRRKDSATAALPEVIWDAELDWALIELRDPKLWRPNLLMSSAGQVLTMHIPPAVIAPPTADVLIIAGVSKEVNGIGLGTVGGILLPWSSAEIKTWSIEGEIAVGDSGSAAICPSTGMIYGIVVAYDSDTYMTYIVPMSLIFASITSHFGQISTALPVLFSLPSKLLHSDDKPVDREALFIVAPTQKQSIYELFLSKLASFTTNGASGQSYVHTSLLVDWLLSKHYSTASNLELLLDYAYSDCVFVPVEAHQVSNMGNSSLVVFSLLLENGYGDVVHLFLRRGLTDSKLPFPLSTLEQVSAASDKSGNADFAHQIFVKQWAFCPVKLELDMARDLEPSCVLPIQKKARINSKGGTSSIWRISVPEEFVDTTIRRVVAPANPRGSARNGPLYQFALKTFDSGHESQFETEREAFRAVQGNKQLIRFLGDFKQGNSCHILLEYGDADLDEYFASIPPPVLPLDIIHFWHELFGVAEAVQRLHSFKYHRAGSQHQFRGWHADVKPDNILRVNGSFKLADLGFTALKKGVSDGVLIRGGTETYGAPETLRAKRNQRLSQAIDIWSLGCVFSEAASWLVLGEHGVQRYSDVRAKEIERLDLENLDESQSVERAQLGNYSFHNGQRTLSAVYTWHDYLRNGIRKTDYVTTKVLDLIEQGMLLEDPEKRYSANEVSTRLKLICYDAEQEVDRRSKRQHVPSSLPYRGSAEIIDSSPRKQSQVASGSQSEIVRQMDEGKGPPISEDHLLERSYRNSNLQYTPQSNQNHEPDYGPYSNYPESLPSPVAELSASDSAATFSGTHHSTRSQTSEDRRISEEASAPIATAISESLNSRGVPTMTIAEARKNFDRKKSNSLFGRFKPEKADAFISRYFGNRDIVFLVDNGETMERHWSEVTNLLETLAYLLRQQDPDGLDLFFTFGQSMLRKKSPRRLRDAMSAKAAKPSEGVHTNMASALSKVLSTYLQQLTKSPRRTRSMSVYVLTDGVWLGNPGVDGVHKVLREFCSKLEKLDTSVLESERRVGVQFIQFGNDSAATDKLKELDQNLPKEGIPDIVDTEPLNGNVYKMLLGNFVDEFDYADGQTGQDAEESSKTRAVTERKARFPPMLASDQLASAGSPRPAPFSPGGDLGRTGAKIPWIGNPENLEATES